jgi:hypothetical protein
LDELLTRVQNEHVPLQIVRNGRTVAELRPVGSSNACRWQLAEIDPDLKPQVAREDALAPLDDDDWPAEDRL